MASFYILALPASSAQLHPKTTQVADLERFVADGVQHFPVNESSQVQCLAQDHAVLQHLRPTSKTLAAADHIMMLTSLHAVYAVMRASPPIHCSQSALQTLEHCILIISTGIYEAHRPEARPQMRLTALLPQASLRRPTWMSCCADTLCALLLSAASALFEGRKTVACSALLLNWETSPAACTLNLKVPSTNST